jgi:hypothetical protein
MPRRRGAARAGRPLGALPRRVNLRSIPWVNGGFLRPVAVAVPCGVRRPRCVSEVEAADLKSSVVADRPGAPAEGVRSVVARRNGELQQVRRERLAVDDREGQIQVAHVARPQAERRANRSAETRWLVAARRRPAGRWPAPRATGPRATGPRATGPRATGPRATFRSVDIHARLLELPVAASVSRLIEASCLFMLDFLRDTRPKSLQTRSHGTFGRGHQRDRPNRRRTSHQARVRGWPRWVPSARPKPPPMASDARSCGRRAMVRGQAPG